jgi:hypothetical protein
MPGSWNHLLPWLRTIDQRRRAALTGYEAFFWRGARFGDSRTTPSGFWSSC